MEATFKKFLNTGVGYLSQGNKLVQTAIEKLVKENKISEQEGQKIVADLLKSGETKRADLEKQFKKLTTDLRTRVGLGDKEAPAPATKARPAAKEPASRPAPKATGAPKKAANKDKAGATAAKTQHSAATKAGAARKKDEKA